MNPNGQRTPQWAQRIAALISMLIIAGASAMIIRWQTGHLDTGDWGSAMALVALYSVARARQEKGP